VASLGEDIRDQHHIAIGHSQIGSQFMKDRPQILHPNQLRPYTQEEIDILIQGLANDGY